jgi:hypothetical protein
MNLKFEIMLLFIGGLMQILSQLSHIWYLLSQSFKNNTLYYLCGSFIIAPSVVFFLLTFTTLCTNCFKSNLDGLIFKVGLGLLITIGSPFGLPQFVYAVILSKSKPNEEDLNILEGIVKGTSLVEALFESIPLLGLQFYNNQQQNQWNLVGIFSVSSNACCIIYTCYKLCKSLDDMRQYEIASGGIEQTKIERISSSKVMDLNSGRTEKTPNSSKVITNKASEDFVVYDYDQAK